MQEGIGKAAGRRAALIGGLLGVGFAGGTILLQWGPPQWVLLGTPLSVLLFGVITHLGPRTRLSAFLASGGVLLLFLAWASSQGTLTTEPRTPLFHCLWLTLLPLAFVAGFLPPIRNRLTRWDAG